MAALMETDRRTAFALLQADITELLPTVYTPTVGDACLAWGTLLPRPQGLYLSARTHARRVRQIVDTWPDDNVRIAVITDGERILGLGDLGAHGMGIPTGKAMVYGACGLDPDSVLPVLVDAGCNTASVVDDPFYVGERQPRLRGAAYDAFMTEVVDAIRGRYGPGTIIHWEDVSSANSFRLLQRLRSRGVPTFNDDIECTASVTLAAILGAVRVPGVPRLADQTFLFFGAGQASIGCATLLVRGLMQVGGLSEADARSRVWMMDSKGLLLDDRTDLSPQKFPFAQSAAELKRRLMAVGTFAIAPDPSLLLAAVSALRPSCLIGAASVGGAFDERVLRTLANGVSAVNGARGRPTVLALSNPTSKAECTYQQAYDATSGAAVFASGTQFPPISTPGDKGARTRTPAQANNCFVFPGIGMGCVAAGAADVTQGMLLAAARAVAGLLTESELLVESVLPSVDRLPEAALAVASAVAAAAVSDGSARNLACVGEVMAGVGGPGVVLRCVSAVKFDAAAA